MELLVILLKKEPEVLEKLIKLAGESGVADNFIEGDEFPEKDAGAGRVEAVREAAEEVERLSLVDRP